MGKNYTQLEKISGLTYNTKRICLFVIVCLFAFNTTLFAQADLSINKAVSNSTPFIGDVIIFTITVSNAGPDVATGVRVQDIVPDGYINITNINNNGATLGNNVNWNNLTIPVNGSIVLTLSVTVSPTGQYNNQAQITASNNVDPDSDPTSGFDEDDLNDSIDDDDESNLVIVTPIFRSDLSLTKSVDDTTPMVGDNITFSLTLTNSGPETATGVTVEDVIQSGFGNYTTINNGGVATGNVIQWSDLIINAGQQIILSVTVEVLTSGIYTNQAEIIASNSFDVDSDPTSSFDTDDLNDSVSDDDETQLILISPIGVSDLSLTKEVDELRPNQGTPVIFTITVINDGPSDANSVSVKDQLPQGFIWLSDDSFGDYDVTSGIWTLGTLANGSSETLNITAIVNTIGDYTNTAEIISSDSFDPDSVVNNNDATEDDQASVTLDPEGLLIPEGFSPNGDSINETFEIPGLGFLYPNFKMEIYNRYGNKVYSYSNEGRTTPIWWNGFSDGRLTVGGKNPLPTGTYYYTLYFNQDNLEPYTNWIYLNR
tara:strand:- start:79347 stop:80972 length:1626 start_codon:yes stop_codon:yes gene_type:complete